MKKEEFRQALRDKLSRVSLQERMTWNDTNLFRWWLAAKAGDSYLTWERCSGDVWQHVPGMCSDLIWQNAS